MPTFNDNHDNERDEETAGKFFSRDIEKKRRTRGKNDSFFIDDLFLSRLLFLHHVRSDINDIVLEKDNGSKVGALAYDQ